MPTKKGKSIKGKAVTKRVTKTQAKKCALVVKDYAIQQGRKGAKKAKRSLKNLVSYVGSKSKKK